MGASPTHPPPSSAPNGSDSPVTIITLLRLALAWNVALEAASSTTQNHHAGAAAAATPILRTMLWDGDYLLRARAAADTNPATADAVAALHSVATAHLHDGPYSVLDKDVMPPSGDKRDFMTISAYYWPCNETCNTSLAPNGDCSRFCGSSNNHCNYTAIPSGCAAAMAHRPGHNNWCNNGPQVFSDKTGKGGDCSCPACDKATGLPWAAHDGYNWPHPTDDRSDVDKVWFGVVPLTLGWFYTGEQVFLDRAVALLRAWFTSPETAMRPNLRYADSIPGVGAECGGTVNFARFSRALDCITMIEHGDKSAKSWTAADRQAMRAFVREFLDWWLDSQDGSCVREHKYNIGMSYELNVLAMAIYLNDTVLARSIASNHTTTRLDTQINGAGEPFHDAPRPDGFGYAAGDFSGLLDLARLSRLAGGSDLYTYVNASTGATLHSVGDFFAPFCMARCNASSLGHDAMAKCLGWPFHQIDTFPMSRCKMMFAQAAAAYGNSSWHRIAANSPYDKPDDFFSFGLNMTSWVQLVYANLNTDSAGLFAFKTDDEHEEEEEQQQEEGCPAPKHYRVSIIERSLGPGGGALISGPDGNASSVFSQTFNPAWFPSSNGPAGNSKGHVAEGLVLRVQDPNQKHNASWEWGALAVVRADLEAQPAWADNATNEAITYAGATPPRKGDGWHAVDPRAAFLPSTGTYYVAWDKCNNGCGYRQTQLSSTIDPYDHSSWVHHGNFLSNSSAQYLTAGASMLLRVGQRPHLAFVASGARFHPHAEEVLLIATSQDATNWVTVPCELNVTNVCCEDMSNNGTQLSDCQSENCCSQSQAVHTRSVLLASRPKCWDSGGICAGPQPERLSNGDYLVLFNHDSHNVSASWHSVHVGRCSIGWAILDGAEPTRVVARGSTPLLSAELPFEVQGHVPEAVFADGLRPMGGDEFVVTYGAGDDTIGAVRFKVHIGATSSAGLTAAAPPRHALPDTNCTACAHGDCPQHCTRLRPYPPLLPIEPGSYAMNRSTLAMAYNISGMYNPQLAARFGAISFDHDNARQLWLASIPNGSVRHIGLPSSEELLAEQCRLVKQVNPHTRCLVYRNAALGLQWLSSEAAAMYGPNSDRLFLHAPSGPIYNMHGVVSWPNGSAHTPLDQYFFNFSEPSTSRLWNDTILFGGHALGSPHVDGFFVDDDAFGREHPTLQKDCGMSDAAVVDFADKQHAALIRSFESVVAARGMVWNAMRDPDGFEARAWGASTQNPTASNCSAWMAAHCGQDYSDHTMLMTPKCSQHTGRCDETNASAAAFMLLRGPHAFWGGGFWWGNNAVTQPSLFDERIGNLDPGSPLGGCVALVGGHVFTRSFTRLTVKLDCMAFEGHFEPATPAMDDALSQVLVQ